MCHNKQRIYFKNIYKTDLCDCLKRNTKETHLNSSCAYKQGGWLISRIIYSLASGWAYIQGGFKVGFYGNQVIAFFVNCTIIIYISCQKYENFEIQLIGL